MKTIFCLGSFMLLFLSIGTYGQEKSTNIKVQITDENGKLINKEYKSREAMENDPELKELGVEVEVKGSGISVRNKEGIQSISVIQEDGSNSMRIHQSGGSPPPPHPSFGMDEEEHQRMVERRDSLLSMRHQEREARMEEARERREEMRRRMEERREEMHPRSRTIIIDDLSEKDAARFGIKHMNLHLNDLHISPNTKEETFHLSFSAKSNAPVKIKLINQENILLVNDTQELIGRSFEKTYELDEFGRGTYFLQIIQGKNILGRKIKVE